MNNEHFPILNIAFVICFAYPMLHLIPQGRIESKYFYKFS